MNELIDYKEQLPATIDVLKDYVLLSREKLKAYRLKLSALENIGACQEYRDQALSEGQQIGAEVLYAEARLGELLAGAVTRAHILPGVYDDSKLPAGISLNMSSQCQKLALHIEIIEQIVCRAREEGRIPVKADVLRALTVIAKAENPAAEIGVEVGTPVELIRSVKLVMGGIDLDPASSGHAQKTVEANVFYQAKDKSLTKDWVGKVFLSPPCGTKIIDKFILKLLNSFTNGDVSEAILLTYSDSYNPWWQAAARSASAICFTKKGVLKYTRWDTACYGKSHNPTVGQCFFYFGSDAGAFEEEFQKYGVILVSRKSID